MERMAELTRAVEVEWLAAVMNDVAPTKPIDGRTPAEFAWLHMLGSGNDPPDQLAHRYAGAAEY